MGDALSSSSTLAAVDGWWLEARCACAHTSLIPCRMLARELRRETTVGSVAGRLICRRCLARPCQVTLVENPQHDAPGYVGGGGTRRIRLVAC